jgi:hypothetical protein
MSLAVTGHLSPRSDDDVTKAAEVSVLALANVAGLLDTCISLTHFLACMQSNPKPPVDFEQYLYAKKTVVDFQRELKLLHVRTRGFIHSGGVLLPAGSCLV